MMKSHAFVRHNISRVINFNQYLAKKGNFKKGSFLVIINVNFWIFIKTMIMTREEMLLIQFAQNFQNISILCLHPHLYIVMSIQGEKKEKEIRN